MYVCLSANLFTLNSSKTGFLLIGLKTNDNFLKYATPSSLTTTNSVRNLGFTFDKHLTFSDKISALSKSSNYHIRELRYIRPFMCSGGSGVFIFLGGEGTGVATLLSGETQLILSCQTTGYVIAYIKINVKKTSVEV